MTSRQQIILQKVAEKLSIVRTMLDDVMYRTDGLTDNEHSRIREAYDHICEANDLL